MRLQILKNQKKKQKKNPISLVPQNLKKIHNQPNSNLELKLQKNPVTNLFVYVF